MKSHPQLFLLEVEKLMISSVLGHIFEDGTKLKIPFEILSCLYSAWPILRTVFTLAQISKNRGQSMILMPYPCSHFYFDIFGNRLYSKEKRRAWPLLFWIKSVTKIDIKVKVSVSIIHLKGRNLAPFFWRLKPKRKTFWD